MAERLTTAFKRGGAGWGAVLRPMLLAVLVAAIPLAGCLADQMSTNVPVHVTGTATPEKPLLIEQNLYYGGMLHLRVTSAKDVTVHTMPRVEAKKMAAGEEHAYLKSGSSGSTTDFTMMSKVKAGHYVVAVYCDDAAGCPVSVDGTIIQN